MLQMTPQDHEYTGTSPMVSPISAGVLQHTPIPQFRLYPGETPLMDASYREPTLGFRRGTPHPKIELASPAINCNPFGLQGPTPRLRLSLQRRISTDTHSDSSLPQKALFSYLHLHKQGRLFDLLFRNSLPLEGLRICPLL